MTKTKTKTINDLMEWTAFMDQKFCSWYENNIRPTLLKSRGKKETLEMDGRVYGGLKHPNSLARYMPYRLKN